MEKECFFSFFCLRRSFLFFGGLISKVPDPRTVKVWHFWEELDLGLLFSISGFALTVVVITALRVTFKFAFIVVEQEPRAIIRTLAFAIFARNRCWFACWISGRVQVRNVVQPRRDRSQWVVSDIDQHNVIPKFFGFIQKGSRIDSVSCSKQIL